MQDDHRATTEAVGNALDSQPRQRNYCPSLFPAQWPLGRILGTTRRWLISGRFFTYKFGAHPPATPPRNVWPSVPEAKSKLHKISHPQNLRLHFMAFSRAPLRRNDQRDRDLQEYLAHRPHWIHSSPRCLRHRRRIFLVLACARNSPQGDSPNDRHFAPRIILLSTLQFCSG